MLLSVHEFWFLVFIGIFLVLSLFFSSDFLVFFQLLLLFPFLLFTAQDISRISEIEGFTIRYPTVQSEQRIRLVYNFYRHPTVQSEQRIRLLCNIYRYPTVQSEQGISFFFLKFNIKIFFLLAQVSSKLGKNPII